MWILSVFLALTLVLLTEGIQTCETMYECTDDVFSAHRPQDNKARDFKASLALSLVRETLRGSDEQEKAQFVRDLNRIMLSEVSATAEEEVVSMDSSDEGKIDEVIKRNDRILIKRI